MSRALLGSQRDTVMCVVTTHDVEHPDTDVVMCMRMCTCPCVCVCAVGGSLADQMFDFRH